MTKKSYTAPAVVDYGTAEARTLGINDGSVESSSKKQ
jgi:hypothetical protein